MTDISVSNQGSLVIFCPLSKAAIEWVNKNVDIPDYLRLGKNSFACEPRYAADIIAGATEFGLVVT